MTFYFQKPKNIALKGIREIGPDICKNKVYKRFNKLIFPEPDLAEKEIEGALEEWLKKQVDINLNQTINVQDPVYAENVDCPQILAYGIVKNLVNTLNLKKIKFNNQTGFQFIAQFYNRNLIEELKFKILNPGLKSDYYLFKRSIKK